MTTMNLTCGFYGTDTDTCYVTPAGRVWLVACEDELPTVREIDSLPDGATSLDGMVTPEEAIDWCRQIQTASGEVLIEEA